MATKMSSNPLPISFKDFVKQPIAAVAFLSIIAMSYLFIDLKSTFKQQIAEQSARVVKLEEKTDRMQDALRKCDSSLSAATTKLSVLSEMNLIKGK